MSHAIDYKRKSAYLVVLFVVVFSLFVVASSRSVTQQDNGNRRQRNTNQSNSRGPEDRLNQPIWRLRRLTTILGNLRLEISNETQARTHINDAQVKKNFAEYNDVKKTLAEEVTAPLEPCLQLLHDAWSTSLRAVDALKVDNDVKRSNEIAKAAFKLIDEFDVCLHRNGRAAQNAIPEEERQGRTPRGGNNNTGGKDIKVVRRPEGHDDEEATPQALVMAMNDCLERHVTYYGHQVPRLLESAGAQRPFLRNTEPFAVVYNPSALKAQSPVARTMMLAHPMAEYVLRLRAAKFGSRYIDQFRKNWGEPPLVSREDKLLEIDSSVGFLTKCVYESGLVRADPRQVFRKTFEAYDPGESDSFWSQRQSAMSNAYQYGFLPHWIAFDVR